MNLEETPHEMRGGGHLFPEETGKWSVNMAELQK